MAYHKISNTQMECLDRLLVLPLDQQQRMVELIKQYQAATNEREAAKIRLMAADILFYNMGDQG